MKEKTNYGNGVPEKALYLLFGLAVCIAFLGTIVGAVKAMLR